MHVLHGKNEAHLWSLASSQCPLRGEYIKAGCIPNEIISDIGNKKGINNRGMTKKSECTKQRIMQTAISVNLAYPKSSLGANYS